MHAYIYLYDQCLLYEKLMLRCMGDKIELPYTGGDHAIGNSGLYYKRLPCYAEAGSFSCGMYGDR